MIAFKGFSPELTSNYGDHKKENCNFCPGETKKVESAKTARSGFHCCENPFDCLTYYSLNGKNRFFRVEAAGDINEDAQNRIACTEITLLQELSTVAFALEGMRYMIEHPDRFGWQQSYGSVEVKECKAEAHAKDCIAIARGHNPMVRGPEGSILGLIVEDINGAIVNCKLFVQTAELAGQWCTVNPDRQVVEV